MNRLQSSPKTETFAFPFFALPPKQASAWVAETRPAEAASWLASLPFADTAEAAQHLYRALFTLNRMDLDADDRLHLMELYRKPVATVSAGLQSLFAHLSLPLRPRHAQLADFLRELQMEMAYGYKHVLEAARAERKPLDNEAFLLVLARSIQYLGEVLLRSYQVYRPAPQGVWREIHGLYRYAEQHGRQSVIVQTDDHDEQSVERSYLQVLMLGLCGPYQLLQNECFQTNAFLARWAHKAEIVTQVEDIAPVGHFLLDFDADHPAVPFPRDVPLHAAASLRAVNAIELARVVHTFIARLQKGEPARALDLGFECTGIACSDILRRMLRFWGLAGRRHFTRRRTRQPLALCVGLNAIHFFADEQRPFAPPQAGPVIPARALELPDAAVAATDKRDERPVTDIFLVDNHWQVRDESAAGLSIVRRSDAGLPMRVGDVLGIHNPGVNQWRIGVARWIKSPDSRHVEVGVEMLAPSARPLAVRPAGNSSVTYTQALLLPPVEALRQPATLLVSCRGLQPGQDVEIANGDLPVRRVRIMGIAERTTAFCQIVFADVMTG
jgi:hypothetical protein